MSQEKDSKHKGIGRMLTEEGEEEPMGRRREKGRLRGELAGHKGGEVAGSNENDSQEKEESTAASKGARET